MEQCRLISKGRNKQLKEGTASQRKGEKIHPQSYYLAKSFLFEKLLTINFIIFVRNQCFTAVLENQLALLLLSPCFAFLVKLHTVETHFFLHLLFLLETSAPAGRGTHRYKAVLSLTCAEPEGCVMKSIKILPVTASPWE